MAFRGFVERASREEVLGWAWDDDRDDIPVGLLITVDGEAVGRCVANGYRADLREAGIGEGRHAFAFPFSQPLSLWRRHEIAVRRDDAGPHVPGSPRTVEPVSFDRDSQERLSELITAVGTDEELEDRLAFLMRQAGDLRRVHAERRSGLAHPGDRRRLGLREPDPAFARLAGRDRAGRPNALVIDERMPDLRRDAGSHAILSHLRSLRRIGYDVTFAGIGLDGDPRLLEAEGVTCCLRPWYGTIEDVLERQRGAFDLVYLHRMSTASRYGALVRHHQPGARVVYSVADLHFLRLLRQGEVEGRDELRRQSERTRLTELGAAWQADAVVTHSTVEADLLRRHMRPDKVHVVPWSPDRRPARVPFERRLGIAFIGGYAHRPNVDAAIWLVDTIMPHVWAVDPSLPCLLVGSDMPKTLRRLRTDRVEPVGFVDDLSEIFDRVRLTVAPLAYGAGLKGKVLDSLAAGIPCVTTPVAAEGFAFPGLLARLVAASPEDFARAILAVHGDEALFRAASEASSAFAAAFASPDAVDAALGRAAGVPRSEAGPGSSPAGDAKQP